MPIKPFLEAGQITGTHGVRGEVRVMPWCDSPEVYAQLHTLYWDEHGEQPVRVHSRAHKSMALTVIEGVDTVEKAAALRGRILWLRREDMPLPNGRYFVQDLIGCRVFDVDSGAEYGVVTDVSQIGSGDIYHMTGGGREVLIPAIPDIVCRVSPAEDRIDIRPMKGLLDDAD